MIVYFIEMKKFKLMSSVYTGIMMRPRIFQLKIFCLYRRVFICNMCVYIVCNSCFIFFTCGMSDTYS
jgi:hypothetical protein